MLFTLDQLGRRLCTNIFTPPIPLNHPPPGKPSGCLLLTHSGVATTSGTDFVLSSCGQCWPLQSNSELAASSHVKSEVDLVMVEQISFSSFNNKMIFRYSIYKFQTILATGLKQIIVFEYFLHIWFIILYYLFLFYNTRLPGIINKC